MKKRISAILLSILIISGCNLTVDLAGFFYSYSEPDDRFTQRTSLPMHSDPSSLQSIPLTGGKLVYSFAVVSDIHVENSTVPHLQDFIDTMLDPGDRFILDCGDSTQSGTADQFTTYKNIMDSSGIPWFEAIGNHDIYFEGWRNYSSIVGRSIYSFQVGNIGESGSMYVISLDSANSTLGKMQIDWLETTLEEQSGLWDHIVVFFHIQLFSKGLPTIVQFTGTEEIYKLLHLFRINNVDYVFMGHDHIWDYRNFNGVEYITLDPLQKKNSEDSYVRVNVDGEDISFTRVMID